jgi:hypothetical protein
MMLVFFLSFTAGRSFVMLFTDQRFVRMTQDVARAVRRYGANVPYIVAFGRPDLCEFFTSLGLCREVGDGSAAAEAYFTLIGRRLAYVAQELEADIRPAFAGILVLDSDVALYRNIAGRAERSGADFVFQRELPCFERDCLNGGVWWARANSSPVRAVLRRALELMRELALADQDALQLAIGEADGLLNVAYWLADTHPNGFVHAAATLIGHGLRTSRVHLVHANWCARDAKQARLDALDAARGATWLPAPADVNRTVLCEQLRSLDAQNRAVVLNCGAHCERLVATRCRQ